MSKIIVISDLHVGDASGADDFHTSGNDLKFLKFLNWLENQEEVKELIIAGDFFELWQCKIEKSLQVYVEIWSVMNKLASKGKSIIFIPGNHDSLPFAKLCYKTSPFSLGPIRLTKQIKLYRYDNTGDELIIPYYQPHLAIWVEHGHRFDRYNVPREEENNVKRAIKKPIGYYISKIVGVFERIIDKNIDDILLDIWERIREDFENVKKKLSHPFYDVARKLQNHITPASEEYKGDFSEYLEGAEEIAKNIIDKEEVDRCIVVLGHTHRYKLEKLDDRVIYVNAGSWVKSVSTFCLIDLDTLSVSLKEWEGERDLTINEITI